MDPGPQRCKACSQIFVNADKLHGHLGRNAHCLEAYVSGGASASAGGILDDSKVAMTTTDAARLGDAVMRMDVCEALAFMRFSGRTPVSEPVIQVFKRFLHRVAGDDQALSRAVGAASAARPGGS